uniref:Uncharacterized protein n=1 Tax=Anguilla anguilla TaxID=7936 RepID=A0A0E9QYS6_ANGAN
MYGRPFEMPTIACAGPCRSQLPAPGGAGGGLGAG